MISDFQRHSVENVHYNIHYETRALPEAIVFPMHTYTERDMFPVEALHQLCLLIESPFQYRPPSNLTATPGNYYGMHSKNNVYIVWALYVTDDHVHNQSCMTLTSFSMYTYTQWGAKLLIIDLDFPGLFLAESPPNFFLN